MKPSEFCPWDAGGIITGSIVGNKVNFTAEGSYVKDEKKYSIEYTGFFNAKNEFQIMAVGSYLGKIW